MININFRDSRPIYEQIKDGLKRMMITCAIAKDEKLPSVRDLASQMSINPNTIQRAYRELEQEGYIYSVSGRGSFATGNNIEDTRKKAELEQKLNELVHELIFLGCSEDEIHKLVLEIYSDVSAKREGGLSND